MAGSSGRDKKKRGAKTKTVDLSKRYNWPRHVHKSEWWQELKKRVRGYPTGKQISWGIPFAMAEGTGRRVIMVTKGSKEVTVRLRGTATYLCFLHAWEQMPEAVRATDPTEGLVVGEYKLEYQDAYIGSIRSSIQNQLDTLSFAGRLWQIFRAIISGTLSDIQEVLGCSADFVMQAIDERAHEFFTCSLQLDTFTMRLEHE